MYNVVIFGAGQAGLMIKKLLQGECKVTAFADNNYLNLSDYLDDVPIVSPKVLKELNADKIIISILNKYAAVEIYEQLLDEGINENEILNINEMREFFDIRLATIRLLAKEIIEKGVEGCIAELGVYKGYIAKELNILFKDRKLYLFDTFTGFHENDVEYENELFRSNIKNGKFNDTSIEYVKSIMQYPENIIFCKGYFPDTAKNTEEKFAFVSLDADLYLPTYEGLKFFYPRLSKGGCILLHDYNSTQFRGVKKAVSDYAKDNEINIIPLCDLHGSAVII